MADADEEVHRLVFRHSAGRTSPVDVIRASRLRRRRLDHSIYEPTRPDFHLLHFVTRGEGSHQLDFEPLTIAAGDVFHVRPGQVHSFVPSSKHEALILLFRPEALAATPGTPVARWTFRGTLRPRQADFRTLRDLLRVQERVDEDADDIHPATVGGYLLGAILEGLADVVARRDGAKDLRRLRYEELVAAFEDALEGEVSAGLSVTDVARGLGTTSRTLARACREVRAETPKRLLDRHLVLAAKRRLAVTTDTVEAVAYGLGFSEPTNFVKFFRRLTGLTPDGFRRQA